MVFYRGTTSNLKHLKSLLRLYDEASSQFINLAKCRFYYGSMSLTRVARILSIMGFAIDHVPFYYLGVPIFKGNPRARHFQGILGKVKAKLASWKGFLLSMMVRAQLVNVVISRKLLYNFHIYSWPKVVVKSGETS
uniref:Uncharacterized protein n=1 Tax=Cajanus cajan TaxID=3821 RepID=A0A151R168_CAJCA|nr:hypothetical protein KK1_042547 [Cajanus cajan]